MVVYESDIQGRDDFRMRPNMTCGGDEWKALV
jgi:hypothetical protein